MIAVCSDQIEGKGVGIHGLGQFQSEIDQSLFNAHGNLPKK
jgi:hypothetical protein